MFKSGSLAITLIISGVVLTIGSTFLLVVLPIILNPTTNLWIGNGIFSVDIASTEIARETGLSNKSELKPDQALLMVFPSEDIQGIFIKNMKFPIDVVWLNKDKRVVYIVKNFSPDDSATRYTIKPAKYVIELPAGTVESKAISTNDLAIFKIDEEGIK